MPTVAKVVVIKDYFETKFSLANGIAFSGGAIGMMILAPLTEFLIGVYGWRGAIALFAAMNMNCCVAGALMVNPRSRGSFDKQMNFSRTIKYDRLSEDSNTEICEKNHSGVEKPKSNEKTTQFKNSISKLIDLFGFSVLSQYPIFTVYLVAMLLHDLVANGWVLFLVSYTITLGYSNKTAAFFSAIGGGGSLMGRVILGPFVDVGYVSGRFVFFLLAVGGAVTMCCYPFTDVYWMLTVLSFMAGLCLASTTPIFIVMIKEITGNDSNAFSGAVGLQFLSRGIGMLSGGPITGKTILTRFPYDHKCTMSECYKAIFLIKMTLVFTKSRHRPVH